MQPESEPTFGEFVFQVRQSKGWSLREAAKRVGIAHSRLDEIEKMIDARTGKRFVPSYINVVRLAKAYGLAPDELLGRAGHEHGIELEPDEWRLVRAYRTASPQWRAKLLDAAASIEADGGQPS